MVELYVQFIMFEIETRPGNTTKMLEKVFDFPKENSAGIHFGKGFCIKIGKYFKENIQFRYLKKATLQHREFVPNKR